MKALDQVEIDAVSGGVPAPHVLLEFGLFEDYVRFTGRPVPYYYLEGRSNTGRQIP